MKKQLKIVVLAKQVPDTRNVGKDAMTPEGTVNRAALPAIFNPEDLNALEAALFLKDETEGSTVHILTMGPPRAADIIRDAIFRGADGGYLLTDRKFAGSDTLATSYALSCALRKIQPDVIVAGRQAIDGDTAQVGPQVAEKLGLPQVTYAEEILESDSRRGDRKCFGCRVPPEERPPRDEVQECHDGLRDRCGTDVGSCQDGRVEALPTDFRVECRRCRSGR